MSFLHQHYLKLLPHRENDERLIAKDKLFVTISLITLLFSLSYAGISFVIDFKWGIVFQLVCFALLGLNLILYSKHGQLRTGVNLYLGIALFTSIALCSFFTGGLYSPVTPRFVLIPIAGVLMLGYCKDTLGWGITSGIFVIAYLIYDLLGLPAQVLYNTDFRGFFFGLCLSGLVAILFIIAMTFDYNRSQALNLLSNRTQPLTLPGKRLSLPHRQRVLF